MQTDPAGVDTRAVCNTKKSTQSVKTAPYRCAIQERRGVPKSPLT